MYGIGKTTIGEYGYTRYLIRQRIKWIDREESKGGIVNGMEQSDKKGM